MTLPHAAILADSIAPGAARLITIAAWVPTSFTWPHIIVHDTMPRCARSMRAGEVDTYRSEVWSDPAMPLDVRAASRRMQSDDRLTGWRLSAGTAVIHGLRFAALGGAWALERLGWHKQTANRYLAPWAWTYGVVSGTMDAGQGWAQFLRLRMAEDAQPETRLFAQAAHAAIKSSTPAEILHDDWHLPYSRPGEGWLISGSRCAQASWYTPGTRQIDVERDKRRGRWLIRNGHHSPYAHPSRAIGDSWAMERHGPFRGWHQARKQPELMDLGAKGSDGAARTSSREQGGALGEHT